jgi:hypothetical protein
MRIVTAAEEVAGVRPRAIVLAATAEAAAALSDLREANIVVLL